MFLFFDFVFGLFLEMVEVIDRIIINIVENLIGKINIFCFYIFIVFFVSFIFRRFKISIGLEGMIFGIFLKILNFFVV